MCSEFIVWPLEEQTAGVLSQCVVLEDMAERLQFWSSVTPTCRLGRIWNSTEWRRVHLCVQVCAVVCAQSLTVQPWLRQTQSTRGLRVLRCNLKKKKKCQEEQNELSFNLILNPMWVLFQLQIIRQTSLPNELHFPIIIAHVNLLKEWLFSRAGEKLF